MPRNFSWLEDGVIAGMGRPIGSPNELQDLRDMGIQAVVSLTETPFLASLVEEFGFDYRHFPIRDFCPPAPEQVQDFVAFVAAMKREKKPLVVHCGAGVGRTGTMLSCYLVSQGNGAQEAIDKLRRLRPGSVETREQEQAVHDYERTLKLMRAKKQRKRRRKR